VAVAALCVPAEGWGGDDYSSYSSYNDDYGSGGGAAGTLIGIYIAGCCIGYCILQACVSLFTGTFDPSLQC
jgi:hypothetical protein